LTQAAAMCDTAIISICRYSAEGGDRKETDFYLSSAGITEKDIEPAVARLRSVWI